jgi:hypothetical protein
LEKWQMEEEHRQMTCCDLCDEPITFDDEHISERTGKKIPLDIDTYERMAA